MWLMIGTENEIQELELNLLSAPKLKLKTNVSNLKSRTENRDMQFKKTTSF